MNRLLPFFDKVVTLIGCVQFDKNLGVDEHKATCEALRQEIVALFKRIDCVALAQGIDVDLINKATYAFIAFLDEFIIQQLGIHGTLWIMNPLQLIFFGENTAGERFFTQLAALRLQAADYIEVLELYYICLELGYEGQYRFGNKAALFQLKQDLLVQIQGLRRGDEQTLMVMHPPMPSPLSCKPAMPPHRLSLVLGALIGMTITGFFIALHYQAEYYQHQLLQHQQALH